MYKMYNYIKMACNRHYRDLLIWKIFFAKYSKKYLIEILTSFILAMVMAGCSAKVIRLLSPTIDTLYSLSNSSQISKVTFLVLQILILHIVKAIAEFYQQFLIKNISNKTLIQLQKDMLKTILYKEDSNGFFYNKDLSHFTNDISSVRGILSIVLGNWVKHLVTIIFVTFTMFTINSMLSICVIIFFPLSFYLSYKINTKLSKTTTTIQKFLTVTTKKLNDLLTRVKLVKIFSKEEYEYNKFDHLLDRLQIFYKRSAKLEAVITPTMEAIAGIGTAFIITLGAFLLIREEITPGNVIAFNTAFVSIYRPFKSLISMNLYVKTAFTAIGNLLPMINNTYKKESLTVDLASQKIEINEVSLVLNSKIILDKLNMVLDQKNISVIVGESGSGKSSIINLILGFYKSTSGEIKINNHNIQTLDLTNLRSQIDFISQENMIINDTIIKNITYSTNNYSVNEILKIFEQTSLQNIVENLKESFDLEVEHKGYNLSGGQRQLISLTRSIIRNAPILIIDEATSSMDFKTEKKIFNFLAQYRKDKMTIIITHRVKNIINFSKNIFVIKNGQCVGVGSHEHLYKNNYDYKELYDNQK